MKSTEQPIEQTQITGRYLIWICTMLCGAILYTATAAPGVLWGDSADAQIRIAEQDWFGDTGHGVCRSHMPYYLVSVAIRCLTGWTPAWSGNFVSSLAGAITVANIVLLISFYVTRKTVLVASALLLMLSHTIWQMSTGAEVVTFFTMCLSFELIFVIHYIRTGNPLFLAGAAFINGFGWSVHNWAFLLWPAYLGTAFLFRKTIPRSTVRSAALALVVWIIGVIPLLIATLNEYSILHSIPETVRSLLVGKIPNPYATGLNLNLATLKKQILFLGLNFPSPVILLFPLGWWKLRSTIQRPELFFLTTAIGIHLIFAVRYNVADQITFMIPSYLILILFSSVGLDYVLSRYSSRGLAFAVIASCCIGPVVYAFSPGIIERNAQAKQFFPKHITPNRPAISWYLTPWRTGYSGAEEYARSVLSYLPENSVLYSRTAIYNTVRYMIIEEIDRPDLRLPAKRDMRDGKHEPDQEIETLLKSGLVYITGNDSNSSPDWLKKNHNRYRVVPVEELPENFLYRIEINEEKSSSQTEN